MRNRMRIRKFRRIATSAMLLTVVLCSFQANAVMAVDPCLPNATPIVGCGAGYQGSYAYRRAYGDDQTWKVDAVPPGTYFLTPKTAADVANYFRIGVKAWTACSNVPDDDAVAGTAQYADSRIVWLPHEQLGGGEDATIPMAHTVQNSQMGSTICENIQSYIYVAKNPQDNIGTTFYWTDCSGGCNPPSSSMVYLDMPSIFAHEYGHNLGFGHVSNALAIMYAMGATNTTKRYMDTCESLSASKKYACQMGSALFTDFGHFADTVYCETYNEIGTDSIGLFGFTGGSAYPDSGVSLVAFAAAGGTAQLQRYQATGISGYSFYEWREHSGLTTDISTGPFSNGTRPLDYYSRYDNGTHLDSLTWTEYSEAANAILEWPFDPVETNCADIIVYSVDDALATPVYNQIVLDAPNKRVLKVIAPPTGIGEKHSALTCKNAIASVIARNAEWNDYCGTGTCRHYPTNPGPEVYIVGDSWPDILDIPVGTGTATQPNYEFACAGNCRSDMLIYDLDGDGVPEGPLSRIPATTTVEAQKAAWAAQDVNRGRNSETGWHVSLIAGRMWGDPYASVALLDSIKLQYRNMQYNEYPMLKETSYPPVGLAGMYSSYANNYNVFSNQVGTGLREVFSYGGLINIKEFPGWFVRPLTPYANGKLGTKSRLVTWIPNCLLHASWVSETDSKDSIIRSLMFGDTTKTMVAASVAQMDAGWFKYHYRMAHFLANAREAAGAVGAARSVARVSYDAIMAGIAEGGDMAAHALSLSTWGSYTMVGRGTNGGGGGCPIAEVRIEGEWVGGNTVLGRSVNGELKTDLMRCEWLGSLRSGPYEVRIRENEHEQTVLDRVALRVVDHEPSLRAVALDGGRVALGQYYPAESVQTIDGTDAWRSVDVAAGKFLELYPGDTLIVNVPRQKIVRKGVDDELGEGFEMESQSKELPPGDLEGENVRVGSTYDDRVLSETGILVQTSDGRLGWRTRARIYPRERFSESIVDSVYDSQVRLIAIGKHSVRGLGRVVYRQMVDVPVTMPVVARHSSEGNALDAVRSDDASRAIIGPQDTLSLEFASGPVPDGQVRDVFLESRGVYTTIADGGSQAIEMASERFVFSLGPALPNPAVSSVQLLFSLSQDGAANLSIYDVRGRLVRTLVHDKLKAGPQSAVWDGRDDHGRRLGGGVYFYRLESGRQRAEKKVAFVPR